MIYAPDGTLLFSESELACKDTGEWQFAIGFPDALKSLRIAFDAPMKVNSCCRSAAHNAAIGGHPRSLHVYDFPHHPTGGTCAIDIAVPDGNYRGRLSFYAWANGWSVGVGSNFLHLDTRTATLGLPQVMFVY